VDRNFNIQEIRSMGREVDAEKLAIEKFATVSSWRGDMAAKERWDHSGEL
jgi:hypothetical protein